MSLQQQDSFQSAEHIFAAAVDEFKSRMSKEDKEVFQPVASLEDMIKSMEENVSSLGKGPRAMRLMKTCRLIADFGKAMKPYFEVVGIFISSKPDIAAIVWGAVRMVFQLSLNYSSFFEKLAERFHDIAQKLPDYSRQVDLLRERAQSSKWRPSHIQLMKSLSYVYTDILQFCQDASSIFSRGGRLGKVRVVFDLIWTPFDERFESILVRLGKHSARFDNCVSAVLSEEMLLHYEKMDEEIQNNSHKYQLLIDERKQKENNVMSKKILEIRRWIAAPDWTSSFEVALKIRSNNTGYWILENREYQTWVDTELTEGAPRMLVLTGKPGYGKTILSTSIIEDLQTTVRHKWKRDDSNLNGILAFFYFEKHSADKCTYQSALRAVLAQLLRAHQYSKIIIDILALTMMNTGTGQVTATESDISSVLRICLHKLGISFLIFDGLDECLDWKGLVTSICEATVGTQCKIILITRPHLALSENFGHDLYHINLDVLSNHDDIRLFLLPEVDALRGHIAGHQSEPEIVNEITNRANSMFLWAKLMVRYLQSPTLTPQERLEAICDMNLLEGLDKLYMRILENVREHLPQRQWIKVQKIFQWIAVASYPLLTPELQIALAVQQSRGATKDDLIPDFEASLVQICGAFVEIKEDLTVHFIHLSVLEFLTDRAPGMCSPYVSNSPFHVDLCSASFFAATTCLRYIIYDVPHKPLRGSSSTTGETQTIELRYPFLKYASQCWPWHTREGISLFCNGAAPKPNESIASHLEALYMMFSIKEIVTLWIEASYTFGFPPSLLDLPFQMTRLKIPRLTAETSLVSEKLKTLSTCLLELHQHWLNVLFENPSEIWLPSINAFMKSECLIGTTEAKIHILASVDDDAILIASQESSNGKEIGMIKVWPSSRRLKNQWKVTYEIWSFNTMAEIFNVELYFPEEHIPSAHWLGGKLTLNAGDFRFPIAFSASLRMVMILGQIIEVHHRPGETPSYSCKKQNLFNSTSRTELSPWNHLLLGNLNKPREFWADELDNLSEMTWTEDHLEYVFNADFNWFQPYFSADERYLIVLETTSVANNAIGQKCVVHIYKNSQYKRQFAPSFELTASVGVHLHGQLKQAICIHPSHPILALNRLDKPVLWKWDEKDSKLEVAFHYPLNDLAFSQCGTYIIGTVAMGLKENMVPVLINIGRILSKHNLAIESAAADSNTSPQDDRSGTAVQNPLSHQSDPSYHQLAETPSFSTFQGMKQISTLRAETDNAAIMRYMLREDGTLIKESIIRLPRSPMLRTALPTVLNSPGRDVLRVVLNKAAEESYNPFQNRKASDLQLPIIVDRHKRSIPTEISQLQENGANFVPRKYMVQKSLGQSEVLAIGPEF